MLRIPDLVRPIARKAVSIPGRLVPYSAQRRVVTVALNQAFREPLRHDELAFLEGRKVRIRVTDLCLDWLIQVEPGRFSVIDCTLEEDVTISGQGPDFVLLATRLADPDTLFFQRRICIEGDTELGLGVKNTMDSIDWDDLPLPLAKILRGLGAVVGRLQPLLRN
jgi:predicted lipid carrier protein YhbT